MTKPNGNKAKNILLVMFLLILLADGVSVILEPDFTGITRMVLTVLLMWCVLLGYNWAKWLFIILTFLTAALAIGFGVYFLPKSLALALIFIGIGVLISIIPIYMIRSKLLAEYFDGLKANQRL